MRHRTSQYLHNRIKQVHRGIKQRYYPMRGFGSLASAGRFCAAFSDLRQYLRSQSTRSKPLSFLKNVNLPSTMDGIVNFSGDRLMTVDKEQKPPKFHRSIIRGLSSERAFVSLRAGSFPRYTQFTPVNYLHSGIVLRLLQGTATHCLAAA